MKPNEPLPLVVVGGGAAGMIAAWRAGSLGAKVILLEKNSKLGIKLLISGGGKCNITHGGEVEDLRKQFRRNEANFLKHSLYRFTNLDVLEHLNQLGVETYERDNGRVFPTSGKAGEVVHALRRMMERAGVEILPGMPAAELLEDNLGVCGVELPQEIIQTRHVILATGGASYPRTGTTGDGFHWLKKLGHTIVPLRPALAPIILHPVPPTEWQGISLRDCVLKIKVAGKTLAVSRGDLLFTHLGISGPATLEVSRKAYVVMEENPHVDISVDAIPDESDTELQEHLQNEIASNGGRKAETLVESFVPQRLASFILNSAAIDASKKCHQLERAERRALVQTMKNWMIGVAKEIPLERGEVTAGGVNLHEVEPKTMRSRILKGLYICGEALDVAGPIGGYNLQAAFSTGYVAGEAAAKDVMAGHQQTK
ncbi:MAG: NAD(P)/FAD-dependent oxidoreductase [Bacteroidota bacterium]